MARTALNEGESNVPAMICHEREVAGMTRLNPGSDDTIGC